MITALLGLALATEPTPLDPQTPETFVNVIVAARDLYPGVPIAEEDLYTSEIATDHLTKGVFLSPEHVIGRVPHERILANEFVRSERLSPPAPVLEGDVLPGYRVVTLGSHPAAGAVVDLWRTGADRCLLAPGVRVAPAPRHLVVELPLPSIAPVLLAERAGRLEAVQTGTGTKGAPCPP